MKQHTLYTAVGLFRRRQDGLGRSYPVIEINRKEYLLDMQEMVLWTCLSWRILDPEQLQAAYERTVKDLTPALSRPYEDCVDRLLVRGLAVSGVGETGTDALYDLLGSLYVVPVSSSLLLHVWTFLKLTLWDHIPVSKARSLFQKDRPNQEERRVLELSKQALLSTAEIIKCVEASTYDISDDNKLLTALYGDEHTTSENIPFLMRSAVSSRSVILAVSNLYLRKQIIFQRV